MVGGAYPHNTQFIHGEKYTIVHFTIISMKAARILLQNIANNPQSHINRNTNSEFSTSFRSLNKLHALTRSFQFYGSMLSGHASFRGVCRSCVVLLHAPTVGRVGTRCNITTVSNRGVDSFLTVFLLQHRMLTWERKVCNFMTVLV